MGLRDRKPGTTGGAETLAPDPGHAGGGTGAIQALPIRRHTLDTT